MIGRLTSALPGIRIQEDPEYLSGRPRIGAACELRTSHTWRPLAGDRADSATVALLSSLYPLGAGECVRVQWIVCGTHHVSVRGDVPPGGVAVGIPARVIKYRQKPEAEQPAEQTQDAHEAAAQDTIEGMNATDRTAMDRARE
jgi:hypothetical protein